MINKAKINAHTENLFKISSILPSKHLITLNKLLFMHSICYQYSPTSFNDVFKVNSNNENYNLRTRALFKLPNVRLETFKKFPLYSLPFTWNNAGDVTFQTDRYTYFPSFTKKLIFI